MIKIAITIDIDTDNPKEAYERLVEIMDSSCASHAWEGTDEWYDNDGEPIEPSVIYPIIKEYWEIQ